MSNPNTPPPVPNPATAPSRMEDFQASAREAFHLGSVNARVRANETREARSLRRREEGGDTMERMDHKNALYEHLGAIALEGGIVIRETKATSKSYTRLNDDRPKQATRSVLDTGVTHLGETPFARTTVERLTARRWHKKSQEFQSAKDDHLKDDHIYHGKNSGHESKRSINSRVKQAERAARARGASHSEIKQVGLQERARRVRPESVTQSRNRVAHEKEQADLEKMTEQKHLRRWRDNKQQRAIGKIKTSHRKAEKAGEKVEQAQEARDLLRIERTFGKADRAVNRATRRQQKYDRNSRKDYRFRSDARQQKASDKATAEATKVANAQQYAQEARDLFRDYAQYNRITPEQAVQLISYADVLPADQVDAQVEATLRQPNGRKYAQELKDLVSEHGLTKLIDGRDATIGADEAVDRALRRLSNHGVTMSLYGHSNSWYLWDVAKQSYYALHPDEADPNYRIADPLTDPAKQQEIIDRHVGWEAYRAYSQATPADQANFVNLHHLNPLVQQYLETLPKDNGTLSSNQLAELGNLIV